MKRKQEETAGKMLLKGEYQGKIAASTGLLAKEMAKLSEKLRLN